jgi:hypothetical protein
VTSLHITDSGYSTPKPDFDPLLNSTREIDLICEIDSECKFEFGDSECTLKSEIGDFECTFKSVEIFVDISIGDSQIVKISLYISIAFI